MEEEKRLKNELLFKLFEYYFNFNKKELTTDNDIEEYLDSLTVLFKKKDFTKEEIKSLFFSEKYQNFFLHEVFGYGKKVKLQSLIQGRSTIATDKDAYVERKQSIAEKGEENNLDGYFKTFNDFKIDYYCLKLGFDNYKHAKKCQFDVTQKANLEYVPVVEQILQAITESHQSIFDEIQKIKESTSKLSSSKTSTSDISKKINSLSKRVNLLKEESNNNFKVLERNQNNDSNELRKNQSQISSSLDNILIEINKFKDIKNQVDKAKDEIILNQKSSTKQLKKYSWTIGVIVVISGITLAILNYTNKTDNKRDDIKSDFVFRYKNKAITQKHLSIPYDTIYTYWEGLAKIYKDSTYGFIDLKGNFLFSLDCDYVTSFVNGFAIVKKKDKYSYINKKGELLDDFKYRKANVFHGGLALVEDDNGLKFIDTNGRDSLILNTKYAFVGNFSEGLAVFKKQNTFGIIDKRGKEIKTFSQSQFDTIYSFYNDIAIIEKDNKFGLINTKGKILLPQIYTKMSRNKYGFYLFGVTWNNKTYSVANKNGEIISNRFTDYVSTIFPFEDVVRIMDKKSKKFKVIDEHGKTLISPVLDRLGKFYDGVAFAQTKQNGDYYFIDKVGNTLLTVKYGRYDRISDHYADLMYVQKNKKFGFIDNSGEQVIPLIYDEVCYVCFSYGDFSPVKIDGKWGIINKKGDLTASFKYDYLFYYDNDLFWAKLEDKEFIINEKGLIIANNKYY